MLILLLCYVSLYIVYVVGDSILAQETASLCCDEDVVLQTDASKVLVGLYLIKADEFCKCPLLFQSSISAGIK